MQIQRKQRQFNEVLQQTKIQINKFKFQESLLKRKHKKHKNKILGQFKKQKAGQKKNSRIRMQNLSINQLSWPQFACEYKLIKNVDSSSFYSPFSLYLNIRTKQKYLIKQIAFQNPQQLQIILEEIKKANLSYNINNRQYLCKMTALCIKVQSKQESRISNSRLTSFLSKQGKIMLLYEHFKTLQEKIQSLLLSQNEHSFIQGDSEIITIKNLPYFQSMISEKTLINILNTLISTIVFIKQHGIEFIKSFTFQMIQIQNLGSLEQRCKVLFYPFTDKDIAEMVWNQQFLIDDSYVGQKVLQSINSFQINEFKQIRLQENERQSFSLNKKFQPYNLTSQNLSHQDISQSLFQSAGLLILKISSLSLGKDTYIQTKFYKMNEKYQLALNFQTIHYLLSQIKRNGVYSKSLIDKIQNLIYQNGNSEIIDELLRFQYQNKKLKEKNYSPLKDRKTFSIGKVPTKQKKSINMNFNLTPSKKVGIEMSKIINKSDIQINETLKQRNLYQNPKSKSKSQSNSRSNSIMRDKSKLLSSVPKPKQFSPSLVQKNLKSSSKKSLSPNGGINRNTSFSINHGVNISSERQIFIETLKQKILYDPNTGLIHQNIISKQFRDGSTYLGQYNPSRNIKQGYGLYFYFDGDIYGGTWKNDQLNGLGIYCFANGDSYEGGVVNGEKDGYGIYKYGNGNIYRGQWKSDKKQGKGEFIYGNGDSYIGEFVEGRKQGHGVYKWPNGDFYEGNFVRNMKHGRGKFQKANSQDSIEGRWQNDIFVDDQEAKIYYGQSGKFYQGNILQNGIIDGYGTYHFTKNCYYQGQIKNNTYQGQCTIQYDNGDIYKGQIKNNLFEGHGEYYFAQKSLKYIGSWFNGKQHGLGQLLYVKDGTIIETRWQNGSYGRHKAVIIYKDGSRYEGDINQNGRHGRGKYIYPDGKWIEGQFDSNKLVHLYQIFE